MYTTGIPLASAFNHEPEIKLSLQNPREELLAKAKGFDIYNNVSMQLSLMGETDLFSIFFSLTVMAKPFGYAGYTVIIN